MSDAVVLSSLTKTFGDLVAVSELDLVVPYGALYGLIGPNGAGKTTAIRMMLSILFPDRGEVSVLGKASALEAKDRIGYLPEERGLYKKMRVRSFLTYMASLKGARDAGLERRVNDWLERVELAAVRDKRCEELSKGMQQKVQVLAAMIHQPDLLVLDEPFSGLDPVNQRLLRDLVLEEHRRGATILFSTHVMVHAEQLCDRVVMLNRGRKVLDATMGAIRAQFDPRSLLFEPLDPHADLAPLSALPGVLRVARDGSAWNIEFVEGANPADAIRAVAGAVTPSRVELRRPTLEDVFVALVSEASPGGAEDGDRMRATLREPSSGVGVQA